MSNSNKPNSRFDVRGIAVILIFILGVIVIVPYLDIQGYAVKEQATTPEKVANVTAYVKPVIVSEPQGDYLPLMVLNTGDLPLYELRIYVKSCIMSELGKDYEAHYLPALLQYNEEMLKFRDSETIEISRSKFCQYDAETGLIVNLSEIHNSSKYDLCPYNIIILSDKVNVTVSGGVVFPKLL